MRIKDLLRINSNRCYTKEEILKYREIYAKDEEIYIAVIVPVTAFVVSMLIANISYFVNSITEHPYALFGCGFFSAMLGLLIGVWYQEASIYQYAFNNSEYRNNPFLAIPSSKFIILEWGMRVCSWIYYPCAMFGVCLSVWRFNEIINQPLSLKIKMATATFSFVVVVVAIRKNNLVNIFKREIHREINQNESVQLSYREEN